MVKEGQKIKQKIKLVQKSKTKTKTQQRLKSKQLQQQKQRLARIQVHKQVLKQLQQQKQRLARIQVPKQVLKQLHKIGKIPKILKKIPFPPPIKIKKKVTPKKRVKKLKPIKKQAYSVYARPLKRSGQKKKTKLIRVSKVPLSKKKAKNLRNYLTDTSLSRTAKIKKTKGKPQKSKLKIPKGYAKKTSRKFRTYKIVKGKRKRLPKGTVIEKRGYLLDTRQEKKKITLRKRIIQITKKPKVKRSVRKTRTQPTIKRSPNKNIKRTPSQSQLNALAKGRKKLAQKRKR